VSDRHSTLLKEQQDVLGSIREYASRRNTAASLAATQSATQRFDPGAMANEIDLITSDALTSSVARSLGLHNDETFLNHAGYPSRHLRKAGYS
jgi:hypothetical protein